MADLPQHVSTEVPPEDWKSDDSLFWVSGVLFPEIREPFWPQRQFPLVPGSELAEDAVLEVQGMGLQYCVHVQQRRDPALRVRTAPGWDRHQFLWTDLPVFAEEPCEWHYPKLQVGYNVNRLEPPANLRPEANIPQRYGYMPNGDIVMHWALAEPLADEFELDVEALPSTVDNHVLVSAQGVAEEALLEAPVGQGAEAGIVLSQRERAHIADACTYIESLGGQATVFEPGASAMFYRLLVPVIRCEWELNPYLETMWESLDINAPRLVSYDFRIVDNPASRDEPIFATERGNVVVSDAFYERLRGLLNATRGPDPGRVLPLIRTP